MNESYQIFKIVEDQLTVYRGEFGEESQEYESEADAIQALKYTPAYEEYVILKKYIKEPNIFEDDDIAK